jgi:polyisoprenoid-binding protein YceI
MATQTQDTATATTWAFDPAHTSVEFRAKHMMVTTVKGRFPDVNGTIVGDIEHPHNAEIDVTINPATIDTRNEQRDTHLRSADFLDVENYPTITFKSTHIEPVGKNHLKVSGDLTIRGVTRAVVLDTELNGVEKSPWGSDVAGITARGEINRKDFGLVWNVALESGGWLVGDRVNIEIDIEAVKQG